MPKKIGLMLLAALIIIQFFRPQRNDSLSTENEISKAYKIPIDVHEILKEKCFNCHSNATAYPWYYSIQPVAWWMAEHIEHGKSHLNFSEFLTYDEKRAKNKFEEIEEQVREGAMPINSYLIMHPDAKLTAAETELLIAWVKELR
jgi:hypothetical protein